MTVRLARDIGMPLIAETARRFGIYDNMPPMLSFSLGAGETTLMRMVTAYSMLDNGGKQIKATLIDRIQDRWGHTIYRHDERECLGCDADKGFRPTTSRSWWTRANRFWTRSPPIRSPRSWRA